MQPDNRHGTSPRSVASKNCRTILGINKAGVHYTYRVQQCNFGLFTLKRDLPQLTQWIRFDYQVKTEIGTLTSDTVSEYKGELFDSPQPKDVQGHFQVSS